MPLKDTLNNTFVHIMIKIHILNHNNRTENSVVGYEWNTVHLLECKSSPMSEHASVEPNVKVNFIRHPNECSRTASDSSSPDEGLLLLLKTRLKRLKMNLRKPRRGKQQTSTVMNENSNTRTSVAASAETKEDERRCCDI